MKRLWVYSIFLFPLCLAACRHLPPITTCLSDVKRQVFHCVDRQDKEFDCAFTDMGCADKLVSIPFQDFGIVLDYCSALKTKP